MLRRGQSTVRSIEDDAYQEMFELEDEHWWFRGRRGVLWALLHKSGTTGAENMLDAGCGTGRNLIEFGALGPITGIDPSGEAVHFCHLRGLTQVKQASLASLPFPQDHFDLLFALDVIEHIEDDRAALHELRRVATASAKLILTVPAHQWMWSDHDVQLHHVRRYQKRQLVAVLEASGWEVELFNAYNSLLFPLAAFARGVGKVLHRKGHTDLDRTPRILNGLLTAVLGIEALWIRHGGKFPMGVSYGLVARPKKVDN